MTEKEPITRQIKERLRNYTAMLRDIDNQIERLERMEEAMLSPSSPNLTGMPHVSGVTDKVGILVTRKIELEEKIKESICKEREENTALENLIKNHLKPDERAVIRLRYFDCAEWPEICKILFGRKKDYEEKMESYLNRTFKLHGSALVGLGGAIEQGTSRKTHEKE